LVSLAVWRSAIVVVQAMFDGVLLVKLAENLTLEKATARVRVSPSMDLHRIENVNVAIGMLSNFCPGLDIDASEIVARNTKLVLGFVWQLILRFQILAGEAWDARGGQANVMKKAREKVLQWWRDQLADYKAQGVVISDSIDDSFGDGIAILALLHKVDPDSVDFTEALRRRRADGWDGKRTNLELAFELAESMLKIAPLLDAGDMCNPDAMQRPDDVCVLTYVSEFPPAFAAVYDAASAAAKRRNEIDRMRAEMEARRAEQERQLETLRRQKDDKAKNSAAEQARLQKEAAERAARLKREFEEKQKQELAELADEMRRQAQMTADQMELLREENAAKVAELQKAMIADATLSRDEQAKLEAERKGELARLQEEAELLAAMKDEELRQQKLKMSEMLKEKEEELKRELEAREAKERMTAAEYADWQKKREADFDKLRRERDAMAAAIHAEIARLRAENDQLRRGEPHVLVKRAFGTPTWCHMCRSYLWSSKGSQCERTACNYVICSTCMTKHGAPCNCLGDAKRGQVEQDPETLKKLDNADTLSEGWLQKKGYSSGRWQKRWVVVKKGCLIYYATDADAKGGVAKRKGMMLLTDVHLVDYTKDKKTMFAFGIESKSSCMWLGASSESDKTSWIAKLDAAIMHTDDAAQSEKRLEAMFADAAEQDAKTQKLVRLKGGTILISRAAVEAAKAGRDEYVDDADADTVPVPKKPAANNYAEDFGLGQSRRNRAASRANDIDMSMLPNPAVLNANKPAATADVARAKDVPTPKPSAKQLEAGTMRGVTSTTSTATADGAFACDICGKRYPIHDDVLYHKKLRHQDVKSGSAAAVTAAPAAAAAAGPTASAAAAKALVSPRGAGSGSSIPAASAARPAGAAGGLVSPRPAGGAAAAKPNMDGESLRFDTNSVRQAAGAGDSNTSANAEAALSKMAAGSGVAESKRTARQVAMCAKRMIAKGAGSMADRAPIAKELVAAQKELRTALEQAIADCPAQADELREVGKVVQNAVVALVTDLKKMVTDAVSEDESESRLSQGGTDVAQAIVKLVQTLARC
jgi:hypothetical protein